MGAAIVAAKTDTVLPNDASGVQASTVLVTVSIATYVRVIAAGGTSVTSSNGIVVTPESGGVVLNTRGYKASAELSHMRVGSSDGRICIIALEM